MIRNMKKLALKLSRVYSVRKNVKIPIDAHIGIGTIIWAPSRIVFGSNVYIGKNCTIECNGTIGNNVLIANSVGIVGKLDHDYRKVGISIRDAPWVGNEKELSGEVCIGDDVWIGYGAIVLTGASIARGTIVAAGSVVVGSTNPYEIVAGVPAKRVGCRYLRNEAEEHEKMIYGEVISDLNHLDGDF